MKDTIRAVLIIVFCCIAACSEQKTDFEQKTERYIKLISADSLSRHNNMDSAKIILGSIDTTQNTECETALYNLLFFRLYSVNNNQTSLDTMLNFAEYYFKKVNDTIHLAEVYIFKSEECFLYLNDYDCSEYYLEQCKQLASKGNPDHYLLAQVYWLRIHLDLVSGDIQRSLDDVQKEAYHAEKSINNQQIAYGALNTVITLKETGNTDKLSLPLQAALNWAEYLKPEDVAYVYNVYGELALDNKPEIAKDNFLKALDICPNFTLTKKNLALLYLKQGDYKQAEDLCAECTDYYWPEDKIELLKVLAGCKIASNNLAEAIEIQKNIIDQKDSIICRIQEKIHKAKVAKKDKTDTYDNIQSNKSNNSPQFIWTILLICITIILSILCIIAHRKIVELRTQIEYCKQNNPIGEQLYNDFIEGKSTSQWDKKNQLLFLEQYRINNPGTLENIEAEYDNLTPRDKIIIILQINDKTQEEIQNNLGLTSAAYYTAVSRIKKNKKL